MPAITVEEAKQNLQAILEKVAKGEEVTIVQEGKVVARVVPPLSKEQRLAVQHYETPLMSRANP